MATTENIGLITTKDGDGNKHLLYPITKAEAVDGLDDTVSTLAGASSSILSSYTKTLMGLSSTAVPDDAFCQLYLGAGKYGYAIKLLYPDGTPAEGYTITGIDSVTGDTLVTDSNGEVVGTSSSQSVTIQVTSPYCDVESSSHTCASTGILTKIEISVAYGTDIETSSSVTYTFSPKATSVDLCTVGGGGGGGSGDGGGYHSAGTGGGGGYVSNNLGVSLTGITSLVVAIGAGGTGGTVSGTAAGTNGGTTTIKDNLGNILVTASGGNAGANFDYYIYPNVTGGAGNGKGGDCHYDSDYNAYGDDGVIGSVYVFNETTNILPGGGGGAGVYGSSTQAQNGTGRSDSRSYGKGKGYGGDGANPTSSTSGLNGNAGSAPGGGGGGGSYYHYYWSNKSKWTSTSGNGGAGGKGAAYLRFYH